jgi:hypothetical protein
MQNLFVRWLVAFLTSGYLDVSRIALPMMHKAGVLCCHLIVLIPCRPASSVPAAGDFDLAAGLELAGLAEPLYSALSATSC